jgi:hypothetical protein
VEHLQILQNAEHLFIRFICLKCSSPGLQTPMPNTRRENLSPDRAGHMDLILMRTAASPGGSQSEPLFTRAFYVDKGEQTGSYCLSRTNARARGPTALLDPYFRLSQK